MQLRLLVALDGSPLSEEILPRVRPLLEAPALAAGEGRAAPELVIVRVVPSGGTSVEESDALDAGQAYIEAIRERLRSWTDPHGWSVQVREERGDPSERILACADELEPALVAMASHGRSGVTRWVRGSVAERVLRGCRAPLLLATPAAEDEPAHPLRKLLVPLDGSELAARVLPLVTAWARLHQGEVTLLRVEPFLPTAVPSPALQPGTWDPERLKASLEPARRALEEAGVPARVQVEIGVPAGEILGAAHGMDAVVMATHGRSGLSRWWFGSVAEQVLRHVDRPLLVLRPAESASPGERVWGQLAGKG